MSHIKSDGSYGSRPPTEAALDLAGRLEGSALVCAQDGLTRWADIMREGAVELRRLRALAGGREKEVARLRDALEPFASAATMWPHFADLDELLIANVRQSEVDRCATIRVLDLRRAAQALAGRVEDGEP